MQQIDTSMKTTTTAAPAQETATKTLQDSFRTKVVTEPGTAKKVVAKPAPQVAAAAEESPVQQYFFYDTSYHAEEHKDTAEELSFINLDSIFLACEGPEPQEVESMFKGHSLQPHGGVGFAYERRDESAGSWVFLLIIAIATGLGWFVRHNRLKTSETIQSAVNMSAMSRLFRDHNFKNELSFLPVSLLYVVAISLGIFRSMQLFDVYMPTSFPIINYIIVLVAYMALYYLRTGAALLLGICFENTWTMQAYVAISYIFHFICAICLVPVLLVSFYGDFSSQGDMALLYILGGVVAFFFLVRFIRSVGLIISNTKNSRFYLFSYLCILELVPFVVLFKLIMQ